jgi:hypothetical protein
LAPGGVAVLSEDPKGGIYGEGLLEEVAIGRDEQFCRWNVVRAILLLCAAAIGLPAQTFTTLSSFDGTNGTTPLAPLIQGTDGTFMVQPLGAT